MDIRWYVQFGAKTEEEKENCRKTLYAANHVFEELIELLKKDRNALERPSKDLYDCPGWQGRQAHTNGELERIDKLIKLLTLKEIKE